MKITREVAKELLPIVKALAEGKAIQDKIEGVTGWVDTDEINLELEGQKILHRITPEPKCRPFKNQDECWQEMLKHQPFGWLKTKTDGRYSFIGEHYSFQEMFTGGVLKSSTNELVSCASAAFNDYTFADGAPFGMPEEE